MKYKKRCIFCSITIDQKQLREIKVNAKEPGIMTFVGLNPYCFGENMTHQGVFIMNKCSLPMCKKCFGKLSLFDPKYEILDLFWNSAQKILPE